jgi:hypothetical protein
MAHRVYKQWGQYNRASTLKRWLLAYARLYGGIAPTVINGTPTPVVGDHNEAGEQIDPRPH